MSNNNMKVDLSLTADEQALLARHNLTDSDLEYAAFIAEYKELEHMIDAVEIPLDCTRDLHQARSEVSLKRRQKTRKMILEIWAGQEKLANVDNYLCSI